MDKAAVEIFNQNLTQLLKRASTDAPFRSRCLASPAEAFREATGQEVPSGLDLRFMEPAPGEVILPLPKANAGGKKAAQA